MSHTPDGEENMTTAAPEATWTPAYQFDEEGEDYVLRIPRTMVTRDRIQRFLDSVEFEHLVSRSELTQEDADELAREVKHAVWEKARHRREGGIREKAIESIQRLPEGASVEEVIEGLHLLSKVERGLRQIEMGQVVSHDEAKRRFGR